MKNNHRDREIRQRLRSSFRYALSSAALLGAGWFLGSVATRPSTAWAQVRNSAPDQHFLAGDQLSLPILQEIATTLHQMDGRLAHLETVAERLSSDRPGAAKRQP
jgi:hypothetical protein